MERGARGRGVALGYIFTGGQKNLKTKNIMFSLKVAEMHSGLFFLSKLSILWQQLILLHQGTIPEGKYCSLAMRSFFKVTPYLHSRSSTDAFMSVCNFISIRVQEH